MISLFGNRRSAGNRDVIETLNARVVTAATQPAFYLAGGVPDTFNGRFELLVLHCALLVRRLRALEAPGPDMAQALIDTVFRNLDPAMRELGVGDMAVPKRMKRLAEAYLGRSVAYDRALQTGDASAFEAALHRNVYADASPAAALAAYGQAAAAELEATPLAVLRRGEARFPDPATFMTHNDDP